jgi:thymidylate synthase (FAD)
MKTNKKAPLDEMVQLSQAMGFYDTPEMKIVRVLDSGYVQLIDHMGNDSRVAQSARVSYAAGTKSISDDENLIRYLMRNSHTSPFEMVTFTFRVRLPIFVSNQWVRHRTWSFNQISGRYSQMEDAYYVPELDKVTKQNPHNKQGGTDEGVVYPGGDVFGEHTFDLMSEGDSKYAKDWRELFEREQEAIRTTYEQMLDCGMRRELARINLPLAQYTEMYATVDLHNLFHFLKLRLDDHAQYEIRVYAEAILKLISDVVPISVEAFKEYTLNSIKLNGKDIQGLQMLLGGNSNIEEIALNLFSNKRERKEFIDKMNKLINA